MYLELTELDTIEIVQDLLINAIPHKECSADANNGKAQADAALSRQAVSRRCCLESPDFVNFSAAPLRQRKLY